MDVLNRGQYLKLVIGIAFIWVIRRSGRGHSKVWSHFIVGIGNIGILQVPHHGTKAYSYHKLYEPAKFCIISCKSNSTTYPNKDVLKDIYDAGSLYYVVTDDAGTKKEFKYTLVH